MGARSDCVVSTRLKREDCKRTKHDSAFSEWKVLIGPSDWEDHSQGKEGAERYRVHNLPNRSSCSGLYELGIAVPHRGSGHKINKLGPDRIIPVYIGQADNVRTRLQCYGREGAHLENGKSSGEHNESVQQGLGLFSEVFSRGYSVVYRWAPMKNKKDAENTEAQLLDTFDYAWNKGSNGVRRPSDILQKIQKSASRDGWFPSVARKLHIFRQKKMGIKIEACKPPPPEHESGSYSNQENNHLLSQIFKIGRSQPRQVSVRYCFNVDHNNICGVALGRGSVCRRPPVEGRKRCAEHKGMKINGFTSKLIADGKSLTNDVNVESSIVTDPELGGNQASTFSFEKVESQLFGSNSPVCKDLFSICGVTLNDDTPCKRQPVKGRKRCEEHKGIRRVTGSIYKSGARSKQHHIQYPVVESSFVNDYEQAFSETWKFYKLQSPDFSERSPVNEMEKICGIDLEDGTFCMRQPVVGRKRCEKHKGIRITGSKFK